jgi:hypothetical protein
MRCQLDEQIIALRRDVIELQDAKRRLVMERTTLLRYYNVMRQRARRLEEGYDCLMSYATWSRDQFSG